MKDQLVLHKQLSEIREIIHNLCQKSNCLNYTKCKKACTVCTNDSISPYRKIIQNNGGDFNKYLKIRTKLMEYNYPLVISEANKIGGYSKEDLYQEGILGLCEAIDKFNISFGNQFSTFAFFYIRKSILEFIRINQTVRLATKISHLTKITEEAFDNLTQSNPNKIKSITENELLEEIKKIREEKKMGNIDINKKEISGHLARLQLQLTTIEIRPLESNKYEWQEHSDSFYDLLNKELCAELRDSPIWLSEAIKLRFGLGSYSTPTPIDEVSAVLGVGRYGLETEIKKFFERKV